jgi:hypothetical protein
VNCFRPELFWGLDDVDAGLRLVRAGWRLYAAADVFLSLPTPPKALERPGRPRVRLEDPSPRDYYRFRNTVDIGLHYFGLWRVLAALMVRAVLKPIANLPAHPVIATRTLRQNIRAIIDGFRGRLGRRILDALPDDLFAASGTMTDSVALFLTMVHHHRTQPEAGLAGAVAATVLEVAKLAADAGEWATLTVLASDGERIVGARTAVRAPSYSLFALDGDPERPGAALVASEPLDDHAGWREVPDHHLVELAPGQLRIAPLEEPRR